MNATPTLAKYIEELTGALPVIAPVPKKSLAALPLYLTSGFSLHRLELFGRTILIAVVTNPAKPDLSQLAKHRESLATKLGHDVALVFSTLKSYERRRLIEKKIPFIVPGRQLYLPTLLIDLRESFPVGLRTHSETVGWVAQMIILRHLLFRDIVDRPLSTVALTLGYTAMAISQAVDELVALKLCERRQHGRSKAIHFDDAQAALWRKALPFMRSPVKKRYFVRQLDAKRRRNLRAGMTALADLTNLQADATKTVAMSAKEVRNAIAADELNRCALEEDADTIVQSWAYDPLRLSAGPAVDQLSLYLSLKDDPDDRVHIAIEQLVENSK